MEEIESYEELGLTKNESKAYDTLIKFGKSGAGEISRESGVSYSKIYNVLDSLISKGLVKIIPEKSKKFVPSSPEDLIRLIEEKQKRLEKAKEKANELQKFYEVKDKNPVIMGIGKAGFYKIVKEMKETDNYSYSIKYTSEYNPNFVESYKKSKKKRMESKTLARYNKETEKDVKKWLKIKKEMRKIENEGVAMSINDDDHVMISLIKSNITLLITDTPFAKLMKKMFLETYKTAEEIK
jgi:HTH-type transcriptional regulator, sugar sensing transcriptional regulator